MSLLFSYPRLIAFCTVVILAVLYVWWDHRHVMKARAVLAEYDKWRNAHGKRPE